MSSILFRARGIQADLYRRFDAAEQRRFDLAMSADRGRRRLPAAEQKLLDKAADRIRQRWASERAGLELARSIGMRPAAEVAMSGFQIDDGNEWARFFPASYSRVK